MYAKLETYNITRTCFRVVFPEIPLEFVLWKHGFYLAGFEATNKVFSFYEKDYFQDGREIFRELVPRLINYCNGY